VIYALTPSFFCDSRLAVAANRAGHTGVLDISLRDEAVHQLRLMRKNVRSSARWGVRFDLFQGRYELPFDPETEGLQGEKSKLPCFIIAGVDFKNTDLAQLASRMREIASQVICEVYSVEQAVEAINAGFDLVLIKANSCGGQVSPTAAFILLQQLRGYEIPFIMQGGIGPETSALVYAAGGRGIVLGEQLWLATESPFDDLVKSRFSRMDGSESTVVAGQNFHCRLQTASQLPAIQLIEQEITAGKTATAAVVSRLPSQSCTDPFSQASDVAIPIGQEIGLADVSTMNRSVADLLKEFRNRTRRCLTELRSRTPFAPGSQLATATGTEFPVWQGPMTRVSDVSEFCTEVANAGGLPFLALSLLRGPQVKALLTAAAEANKDVSWGVGLLGFVPPELRDEQMAVVEEIKPPFAIIAGGRPSLANRLDKLGIISFLHVPSPGLLRAFIEQGARRFIFEGRECGGHVGPRDSFILWQSVANVISSLPEDVRAELEIVFAGGIHDSYSSALVSLLAAPLEAMGVKVGVLLGTAYLFTEEAVSTGAITQEFQNAAIRCNSTVLLQSGVGHATRCARTPFADEFETLRRELISSGADTDTIRERLEMLNIGRLRLASKGLERQSDPTEQQSRSPLVEVSPEEQRLRGMYMIGEVAQFHDQTQTLRELHESVSTGATQLKSDLVGIAETNGRFARKKRKKRSRELRPHHDLAITGMAGIFPGAEDVRKLWENILTSTDSVAEIPTERWNVEPYFDPDRTAPDRIYSRWGGFLSPVDFNPMKWGMPPSTLASIDPIQLISLEVAWRATVDARLNRNLTGSRRTSVIFSAAGVTDFGDDYLIRSSLRSYLPLTPHLSAADREKVIADLEAVLPEWTEDSFPGFLLNVIAGRIANRLNLSGANFTVDAACAGSLAALHVASNQLRMREADAVIVGAADLSNNPFGYLSFAKTHALSPRGRSRPFDANSDGIAIGEAVASVVVKRLSDAERDGDRIYAVIRGIGFSSDGRNRSMTAPYPKGQRRAMLRAYRDGGVSPKSIGLFEAHGTGTSVGDMSEVNSLLSVLDNTSPEKSPRKAALGSVKSNIGHTKAAAGLVSLIKTSLALHQQVLPPSIGIETPHSQLTDKNSPLYVNTEARPWVAGTGRAKRRAALSSFGFGGTNFHAVLEEYRGCYDPRQQLDLYPRSVEPFAFSADTQEELVTQLEALLAKASSPQATLTELASTCCATSQTAFNKPYRLVMLGRDCKSLCTGIDQAVQKLQSGDTPDNGIDTFFGSAPAISADRVCVLYPGQGAQSVNMLKELFLGSAAGRKLLASADGLLADTLERPLSDYMFPEPVYNDEAERLQKTELSDTAVCQPGLAVVEVLATKLLQQFGIVPGYVAGHSFGEYSAIWAAGCWSTKQLIEIAALRGRICAQASEKQPGAMAVVSSDEATTQKLIDEQSLEVTPANLNGPHQTVIAGTAEQIEAAIQVFTQNELRCSRLNVSAAFHSPLLAESAHEFGQELVKQTMQPPRLKVGSNTLGAVHSNNVAEIQNLLVDHLTNPVQFERMIRELCKEVDLFIELGPKRTLSGMVRRIEPDATLLALDGHGSDAWENMARLLSQCFVLGLPVEFGKWFEERIDRRDHRKAIEEGPTPEKLLPNAPRWTLSPTRPISPQHGNKMIEAIRLADEKGDSGEASVKPAESTPVNGTNHRSSDAGIQPVVPADHEPANSELPVGQPSANAYPESRTLMSIGQLVAFDDDVSPDCSSDTGSAFVQQNDSHELSLLSDFETNGTCPSPAEPHSLETLHVSDQNNNYLLEKWLQLQLEQSRVTDRIISFQEQFLGLESTQTVRSLSKPSAVQRASSNFMATTPATPARPPVYAEAMSRSMPERPKPVPVKSTNGSQPNGRTSTPISDRMRSEMPTGSRIETANGNGNGHASIPASSQSVAVLEPTVTISEPSEAPSREVSQPAAANAHPTTKEFELELLNAVCDRTGYPLEALDLDTPLESGLGIDSIKTVEIFSGLKRFHPVLQKGDLDDEDALADFVTLKTLGDIVRLYESRINEMDGGSVSESPAGQKSASDSVPVETYEVASVPAKKKA